MNDYNKKNRMVRKTAWKVFTGCTVGLTILLTAVFLVFETKTLSAKSLHVVPSKDGTAISYEIHGAGDPTLLFVHGWSCDIRYWNAQTPHFSRNHRVVLIDLAGHGHSGMTRSQYTTKLFGADVRAVAEATGSRDVILIGHSMGGVVIAEAARQMPDRVLGLIGIDTLENVEYPLTSEQFAAMLAPFKKDFKKGTRQFVSTMMLPGNNQQINEWILADMSAAPPAAALSAMTNLLSQHVTGESYKLFDDVKVPVVTVNTDLWPVNYEGNRRHMVSFDAIIMKGTDHFLMLHHPDEFNRSLEKAIKMILNKSTMQKK